MTRQVCSAISQFWRFALTWVIGLSILPLSAAAQQVPAEPPVIPNPSEGRNVRLLDFVSAKTPIEFWLTVLIATFGLAIILLFLWHVRNIAERRVEEVARPIIVVVLITGALILVTAGYSNEQIAPAFGLLGAIAGYILGRLERNQGGTGPATNAAGTVDTPAADPARTTNVTGAG